MLFNSYTFIFLFIPITVAGFFTLARYAGHRVAVGWLTACSLFFYSWWDVTNLPLILASILGNYVVGGLLSAPERGPAARKTILTLGVAANLAALGYFKYTNFLVDNFNALTGAELYVRTIVLPLGISFFTFQQVAFLVDAYRGETREYDFVEYALFVCFYPQLIAGPIVHHKEIIPTFNSRRTDVPLWSNLGLGVAIFTVGLFKKVIIADSVSGTANQVFGAAHAGSTPSLVSAWTGALAYTFQIYFDFSGYSDMCVGLGRMFGVTIAINFNSPYKATSIVDFWRRWHITLSRFLRDYLYIALGGNRKGPVRRYANLFLTMLLGGLWHGASWTFVAWGALHGLMLMVNHAWSHTFPAFGKGNSRGAKGARLAGILLTFGMVIVGWVFFKAPSFHGALAMFEGMLGLKGVGLDDVRRHADTLIWFPVLFPAIWLLPNTNEIFARAQREVDPDFDTIHGRMAPREAKLSFRPTLLWTALVVAMFLWAVTHVDRVQEFLYWQF